MRRKPARPAPPSAPAPDPRSLPSRILAPRNRRALSATMVELAPMAGAGGLALTAHCSPSPGRGITVPPPHGRRDRASFLGLLRWLLDSFSVSVLGRCIVRRGIALERRAAIHDRL